MGKLTVVKFGNSIGKGAVIREDGWFSSRNFTLIESNSVATFNKWVCIETGDYYYATIGKGLTLSLLYRGQYETR